MKFQGALILLYVCSFIACTDNMNSDMEEEEMPAISQPDSEAINGGCIQLEAPIYQENGGLVNIEMESSNYIATFWRLNTDLDGFTGKGFLVWKGSDSFNEPGKGLLSYKVNVQKTGTYRFVWKSYITDGHDPTEFNDSWLRIADATHFYGKKGNGHIVYPRGSSQDPLPGPDGQENNHPAGSSTDGWFKIYMNTADEWAWLSSTSDHDAHAIYAVFEEPGEYTIEISGRSKGHGIDKFVMFHSDVDAGLAFTSTALSEVQCD